MRIYWECEKCGYFIDVEPSQFTASCENPHCDGVMRLKVSHDEK